MIEIEWLFDEHDCETCGWTCAQGALVKIDDKVVANLEPLAHCFNGVDYPTDYVYKVIIESLGHKIKEINGA